MTQYFTTLRPKQRKYLDGLAQGMTKEQAKRFAQYADSTSTASIETPSVKAAFARLVRRAVPAHKLAQRVAEGVDATKSSYVSTKDGVQTFTDPDMRERREYLKLAAEWGEYVAKDAPATQVGVSFQMINGVVPLVNGEVKENPPSD